MFSPRRFNPMGKDDPYQRLESRIDKIEKILEGNQKRQDQNSEMIKIVKDQFTQKIIGFQKNNLEQVNRLKKQLEKQMEASKQEMIQQTNSIFKKLKDDPQMHKSDQINSQIQQLRQELESTNNRLQQVIVKLDEKGLDLKLKKENMNASPQSMVDLTTPFAQNFLIFGNTITEEQPGWRQILLNTVIQKQGVFTLQTRINHLKEAMRIGLLDRRTQKDKQCAEEAYSVYYYSSGSIYYGYGKNGKHEQKKTGDKFTSGMDVTMKVNMREMSVTFTLSTYLHTCSHKVQTSLLLQPNVQLVPYYVMYHHGDSITWQIS